MRTFRELTKEEREMARVLVYSATDEGYSTNDVAELLRLRPTTIAALKAHKTMRECDR